MSRLWPHLGESLNNSQFRTNSCEGAARFQPGFAGIAPLWSLLGQVFSSSAQLASPAALLAGTTGAAANRSRPSLAPICCGLVTKLDNLPGGHDCQQPSFAPFTLYSECRILNAEFLLPQSDVTVPSQPKSQASPQHTAADQHPGNRSSAEGEAVKSQAATGDRNHVVAT